MRGLVVANAVLTGEMRATWHAWAWFQGKQRKILETFSLEPCVVSTQEAVVVTHQMKLSTLVRAAWRYDIPFQKSFKLQTHTAT